MMQSHLQSTDLSDLSGPVSNKEITFSVYTAFEEVASLQEEWDNFVEANGADIFLSFDWCQTWWEYYGNKGRLRIYIFRSNQEMVGIFPLFIERIWLGPVYIDAIKIVGSEYVATQFYLPIHMDLMAPVIHQLIPLLSQENCDVISLGPLTGIYPYADQLEKAIHEVLDSRYQVTLKNTGVQTIFHLARSWDEQLGKMDKKDVKEIGRSYRLLPKSYNESSLAVETDSCSIENFNRYFEEFVEMHRLHWHKLGKLGHFEDWQDSIDFHREVAQKQLAKKRLKLLRVFTRKGCLGYEYDYWFGNKCYELLAARSTEDILAKIGIGKINYCEKMKLLIDNKIDFLDSLRGQYTYKLKLGGEIYNIKSIFILPRMRFKRLRVRAFCGLSRLLHLFYYKIWHYRLAPRLPFTFIRQPLWKLWIKTNQLGETWELISNSKEKG